MSDPVPPTDLPYPPKGDKAAWSAWWQDWRARWSDYWRATGEDPTAGIFGPEGAGPDPLSPAALAMLSPPDFAARLRDLAPRERYRVRQLLGIPPAASERELLRILRGLEESPAMAEAVAAILSRAARGGAA